MLPSQKTEFATLVGDVFAYYGKDSSLFITSVFWESLKGYELEAVRRAFTLHAQDPDRGQFAPKVADIVRLIDGGSGDRAVTAWSKVHYAIKQVGPHQSIAFDDQLIHAVLAEMGGLSPLFDIKTDDMPFRAKEFETRYRALASRRTLPPYPAKFIGDVEAHNRSRGLLEHIPEPVVIGDAKKAALVIQGGRGQLTLHKSLGEAAESIALGKTA